VGGLGHVLLQQGQPIAFGPGKKPYSMEKEMLAIVCGCEKFDQFICEWKVTVKTDHEPLVSIALKQFTEETIKDGIRNLCSCSF